MLPVFPSKAWVVTRSQSEIRRRSVRWIVKVFFALFVFVKAYSYSSTSSLIGQDYFEQNMMYISHHCNHILKFKVLYSECCYLNIIVIYNKNCLKLFVIRSMPSLSLKNCTRTSWSKTSQARKCSSYNFHHLALVWPTWTYMFYLTPRSCCKYRSDYLGSPVCIVRYIHHAQGY